MRKTVTWYLNNREWWQRVLSGATASSVSAKPFYRSYRGTPLGVSTDRTVNFQRTIA